MEESIYRFWGVGDRGKMKKGFTLLEAVIAMAIIAVSVASSLVIMGKLASMTAKEGDIMGIMTASAVAQYTVDEVRDINFPPITTMDKDFSDKSDEKYLDDANSEYTSTTIFTGGNPYTIGSKLDDGTINLIKTAVTVYKNGKPLMTTYTYKVRNGQF